MSFLPKDYKAPKSDSNYMRFEEGENKFRILSDAIVGWEGWKTEDDGTKRPIRIPADETLNVDDVDEEDKIKHFWAFVVWNYAQEKIQILEVTQRGIQKSLNALERSKDWGDIKTFDILVTRSGKTMQDTEYSTNPVPPKPIDREIVKKYEEMQIDLNALFKGDDPFAKDEKKKQDNFINEVSKAIS